MALADQSYLLQYMDFVCPWKVDCAYLLFSSNALFHISLSCTHSRLGAAQCSHRPLLLAPDSISGTLSQLNALLKHTLPSVEEVEEGESVPLSTSDFGNCICGFIGFWAPFSNFFASC